MIDPREFVGVPMTGLLVIIIICDRGVFMSRLSSLQTEVVIFIKTWTR